MNLRNEIGLGLICVVMGISAGLAKASETGGPSRSGGVARKEAVDGCGGKRSQFSVIQIQAKAEEVLGSSAACYMKLFDAETSGNAACEQRKVPNPPGIGLCTLEGDPIKREVRGGPCAVSNDQLGDDDKGIENQMKCCKHILEGPNGIQYFQPILEGTVPDCSKGVTSA